MLVALPLPDARLAAAPSGVEPVAPSPAWDGTHVIGVYSNALRPAVKAALAVIADETCLDFAYRGRPDPGGAAGPYEVVVRFTSLPSGPRAVIEPTLLPGGQELRSTDVSIRRRILKAHRSIRRDIVLHELMHTFGVADSSKQRSVMFPKPRTPYSTLSAADRRELVRVGHCGPAAADCEEPGAMGIALGLHGASGTGEEFAESQGWREAARARGLLPLTPTARESTGRVWDINPGSPDLVMLEELIDRTVRQNCIDTDRIYVAGHSMGAMAATVLACTTRTFAAVAPIAGVVQPPGSCWPGTSLFAVHSSDDTLVTQEGDVVANLYPVVPEWARTVSREQAVASWAEANGCTGSSWRFGTVKGEEHPEPWLEQVYTCPNRTKVRWRVYGHLWHSMPAGWADRAMAFFDRTSR